VVVAAMRGEAYRRADALERSGRFLSSLNY
jgi:hypothetical protein